MHTFWIPLCLQLWRSIQPPHGKWCKNCLKTLLCVLFSICMLLRDLSVNRQQGSETESFTLSHPPVLEKDKSPLTWADQTKKGALKLWSTELNTPFKDFNDKSQHTGFVFLAWQSIRIITCVQHFQGSGFSEKTREKNSWMRRCWHFDVGLS